MPLIMAETDADRISEEVDTMLTAAEEREAEARFAQQSGPVGDLSDGGMVGGARLTPMRDGKKQTKGRPAARRAWMWNGTESLLPLAWNPDGTMHDGGRRYLLKRHCLCCQTGGFRASQCPNCVKSNCTQCRASTDRGKIIPSFYLRKEDVPFPARFYGSINCFLAFCPRQGGKGFLTDQDMRVHARTRHRMEYQAYQDGMVAARSDQVEVLRQRVDELTSLLYSARSETGGGEKKPVDPMAAAHAANAARRAKAAVKAAA